MVSSLGRLSIPWRAAIAVIVGCWMLACALQVSRQASNAGTLGAIALAIAVLLPLLLLKIAKVPVYLFALYAALVPFIDLLPASGGTTITKLIAIVAGGTLILSIIGKSRVVNAPRSLIAVALYIAYAGASSFWAIDPALAGTAYVIVLSLASLFAVVALYPATTRDFTIVLAATMAGALAVAVYGDYSYLHMDPSDSRLAVGESIGHTLDPNYYAASLLMPMSVALVMFIRSRSLLAKLAWGLAGATLCSGFVLSGSRGGIIAFAVMLIFLAWRLPYRMQLATIVLAVVAAIVASGGATRFLSPDVATGDLRFDIWKVGIASLQQYWFAGAGIGNFTNAFSQYFLTVPHQTIPWDRLAHSTLIQSAVEYGIPGLVLVLAVWYYVFSDLADVEGERSVVDICMALRAGIIGLFVAGISLDMMHVKFVWLAFSLVVMLRATVLTAQSERSVAEPSLA